ncbi:hypothetical protein DL240_15340 [Lujinxingia litoralis]|uniref:Phosphoenolpyruvate synthase n=1 Tax=Lujinxingia litoralis TaxID=2211119 RepID=A0A328C257_9DELT|nr:PEP/pyruvate-binding domain-containing protein [Lujinxingia litoralis]RAL20690.1 hypothetical protein DL240_15340 [Lujinxingia litoralis]
MNRSTPNDPIVRFGPERQPHAPSSWTLSLGGPEGPRAISRQRVGGKAYGLWQLNSAGFSVPDAFCVTTEAFEAALLPLSLESPDLESLRQAILHAPLPRTLVEEIEARMASLGASRWAVRSSAAGEDSAQRSFAGQGLTLLNIQGTQGVLDALRQVWASVLRLERLVYEARDNIMLTLDPMAVVIQAMLEPDTAGVFFSLNPLSGDENEVVVSTTTGLGEAVVLGQDSETHYLDKHSGYVRRHVTARGTDASPDHKSLLSPEQLVELASAARGIEHAFGLPVDVEWAYAFTEDTPHHPRLFFVQARPITAAGASPTPPEEVWTNTNVGEALPGVATPMTWSILESFSRRGFQTAFATLGLTLPEDADLVRAFKGRIYLNLSQFMSIASGIPLLSPERLFEMAGGGGVELVRDIYQQRSKRDFFKRLPTTIPKILGAQISMPLVAPLWGRYFTARVEEFFDRDLSQLSTAELQKELDHVDALFDRTGLIMLSVSSNFLMSYALTGEALRLTHQHNPETPRTPRDFIAGLDVKSAEPGLALLDLGRIARRSLRLRNIISTHDPAQVHDALQAQAQHDDVAMFLVELDAFRRHYGHRAPREAELATPRWREDMRFLFEVLRSFIDAPHLPSPIEVMREQKRNRQRLNTERMPALAGKTLSAIVGLTRANARQREYMRDRVVDALDLYRRFFLECGRRLCDHHILSTPDEVFFLTYAELRDWLQAPHLASTYRLRVLTRQGLYDHFRHLPDPPDTFLLRGHEIIAEEPEPIPPGATGTREIRGLGGSPGRVTGIARVILDPADHDATIRPGEILVAPYTDVGWTPLFLTAAGVVMSLGGPLSHSCIVAREYGIPTVVNARQATERIQTGDRITVDGDQGLILIHLASDEP